jgi:ribosomal protein S18 acetylase RimI-like enzyme
MYTIRQARQHEADVIVEQRRGMFLGIGFPDDEQMAKMSRDFRPWLIEKMAAGEYMGWFAETENGEIVAGAGLWLIEWPPHLIGLAKHRGYILNVYTHPDHQRRGLAGKVTQAAVDWSKEHGIDFVFLHASKQGRAVYERLGFVEGSEMRIRF